MLDKYYDDKTFLSDELYEKGINLLKEDDEDISPIENIKVGMWAMCDEGGHTEFSPTKKEAISLMLAYNCQSREHCHVKRIAQGVYSIKVLDPDVDRVWLHFDLTKVLPSNIKYFKKMKLSEMLPDEFFYG